MAMETWKRTHKKFVYGPRVIYKARGYPERVSDSRAQDFYDLSQETTSYRSGSQTSDPNQQDPYQLLADQVEINAQSKGDSGHEFFSTKKEIHTFPRHIAFQKRGVNPDESYVKYWGTPLLVRSEYATIGGSFPDLRTSFNKDYYGSLAINKTIPTKSAANLTGALAELLQNVPSLPFQAMANLNAAKRPGDVARFPGDAYLNAQFGWVPSVSDFQKICEAIFTANKIIDQYVGDSQLQVRRRYSFPTESESTTLSGKYLGILGVGPTNAGEYNDALYQVGYKTPYSVGEGTITTRHTSNVWFSGAYSYMLPDGNTIFEKLKSAESLANRVLGTRLTAETVWNLLPFSWLLDWYYNIGTLVSNASYMGQDGLVLKYGYLMHTQVAEVTYEIPAWEGYTLEGSRTLRTAYTITRKERYRATPYGFARNPNDFTGKQWAILGALGLTKAPRTLK